MKADPPQKDKISRRAYLCCVGALALAVVGWLFEPRPMSAQSGENQTFALEIRSGHVAADKRTIRLTQGVWVELQWTTDEAVELHLHGYDIRLELKRGASGTMTFAANIAGRFPVGIHRAGGHGNIVYLEVYPR